MKSNVYVGPSSRRNEAIKLCTAPREGRGGGQLGVIFDLFD